MPWFDVGNTADSDGSLSWTGDTIQAMVMDSTYVFDPTSATVAAIVGNEDTNFAPRPTIGSKSITLNTGVSPRRNEYRGDNQLTFASVPAGPAPVSVVFYKLVTNDSDSIPLFSAVLNSPSAPNGNNYFINEPATGWAYKDSVGTTA